MQSLQIKGFPYIKIKVKKLNSLVFIIPCKNRSKSTSFYCSNNDKAKSRKEHKEQLFKQYIF